MGGNMGIMIDVLINLAITVMAAIGLKKSYVNNKGWSTLKWFTTDSNLIAGIFCLVYAIYRIRYMINGAKIPDGVYLMRYVATCVLGMTFFIVLLILAPWDRDYKRNFFYDDLLYHHFLCPLLTMISYLIFGQLPYKDMIATFVGAAPIFLYGFVSMILNVARVMEGPYPFLLVYKNGFWKSIMWMAIILTFGFSMSLIFAMVK